MDRPVQERVSILEERDRALRREIALQAAEYARRLDELNHAHAKQVTDQQTYVSGDTYRGWQGEINTFREEVGRFMAAQMARSAGSSGTRDLALQIMVAISIAASAIVGLYALWNHK